MVRRGTGGYGSERMAMTYTYTAYSLTLRTPFPCPVLPIAPADAAPDVTVVYGHVPMNLAGSVAVDDSWGMGYCWQAAPRRFLLLTGLRAGRFLIEDGRMVIVERNPAAEDEMIVFHLLHSVMAAVMRQRGLLVLHANVAFTQVGTVGMSGKSGAGKSTTLAALLQRGCEMIADDIAVLRFGETGSVEVLPGLAQMYIWEDAALRLGLNLAGLASHPLRRRKTAVAAPVGTTGLPPGPFPLRAVYLLECNDVEQLCMSSLTGVEKFAALQECVYGPMLPDEHHGLFRLFSAAVEQVAVHRIIRPEGRWTVDEVAEVILDG